MIMNDAKKRLRREILKKRKFFSNRTESDRKITQKLICECLKYEKIFVYINYGSEVATTVFINEMLSKGKKIYVPVCDTSTCTMVACRIFSLNDLKKNEYGILEPLNHNELSFDFDAIVFPGAVFDVSGHRIGYGKGYYDKFVSELKAHSVKIGVCYDFQLQTEIPFETHDVKMDIILTESRKIIV